MRPMVRGKSIAASVAEAISTGTTTGVSTAATGSGVMVRFSASRIELV